MKYTALLITSLLLAFAWPAQATTLTVDFTVPYKPERPEAVPIILGVGYHGGSHQYLFDDLIGTELLGQTISLDIDFAGDQFVRVFTLTSRRLELALQGFAIGGNVSDASGYVTGKNGKEVKEASSLVSQNWIGLGLFPNYSPILGDNPYINPDLKNPFDFYGAHFDITLGNYPGSYLGQIGFMMTSNMDGLYEYGTATALGIGPSDYLPKDVDNAADAIMWINAARVPDSGSTLAMFGLALVAIGGFTRFRALA